MPSGNPSCTCGMESKDSAQLHSRWADLAAVHPKSQTLARKKNKGIERPSQGDLHKLHAQQHLGMAAHCSKQLAVFKS